MLILHVKMLMCGHDLTVVSMGKWIMKINYAFVVCMHKFKRRARCVCCSKSASSCPTVSWRCSSAIPCRRWRPSGPTPPHSRCRSSLPIWRWTRHVLSPTWVTSCTWGRTTLVPSLISYVTTVGGRSGVFTAATKVCALVLWSVLLPHTFQSLHYSHSSLFKADHFCQSAYTSPTSGHLVAPDVQNGKLCAISGGRRQCRHMFATLLTATSSCCCCHSCWVSRLITSATDCFRLKMHRPGL